MITTALLDLVFMKEKLKVGLQKLCLVWWEPGVRDVFCTALELGV